MQRPGWQARLNAAAVPAGIASWLREPGSLTARLVKNSRQFRVRLLASGNGRALGGWPPNSRARQARVREVVLEADGIPVIFAHTVIPAHARGRLRRWLAGLGERSLGSLLFTHPGFQRTPLTYRRLPRNHPLYRRASPWTDHPTPTLWARACRHRLGGESVQVVEVMLPVLGRLHG